MKNIKTLYKDHKQKIILGSKIVGVAVIGAIAYTLGSKRKVEDLHEGKDMLWWTPTNNFINLEKVKEVLDLNANNSESFAIFRNGELEIDRYACILISDNVITDKSGEA